MSAHLRRRPAPTRAARPAGRDRQGGGRCGRSCPSPPVDEARAARRRRVEPGRARVGIGQVTRARPARPTSKATTPAGVRCLPPGLHARPVPAPEGAVDRAVRDPLQRRRAETASGRHGSARHGLARRAAARRREAQPIGVRLDQVARRRRRRAPIGESIHRIGAELRGEASGARPRRSAAGRAPSPRRHASPRRAGRRPRSAARPASTPPRYSSRSRAFHDRSLGTVVRVRPGTDAGVCAPGPVRARCAATRARAAPTSSARSAR